MAFAFINQPDGWVESFHLPARASEPGEKYSAQDATQVAKIINAGNAETNQQVDAGHVNDVHQRPVGPVAEQLAVLEDENPFRRQQAKDGRGGSQ